MAERYVKTVAPLKIPLVVVDFDKTIIPFDSFKKYLLSWIKYHPLELICFIILRKTRVVSAVWFKKKALSLILSDSRHVKTDIAFAESLVFYINLNLLAECKARAGVKGKILILSASPHCYISLVGSLLDLMAQGSYFNSSEIFIHLHGQGKIDYLASNYPINEYEYTYAVSDSNSDIQLLKLFRNYKII